MPHMVYKAQSLGWSKARVFRESKTILFIGFRIGVQTLREAAWFTGMGMMDHLSYPASGRLNQGCSECEASLGCTVPWLAWATV